MASRDPADDARQLRFLEQPVGERGSGCVRYAAAMYFNRRGMIGEETLEAYRICAPDDDKDPAALIDADWRGGEIAALKRNIHKETSTS